MRAAAPPRWPSPPGYPSRGRGAGSGASSGWEVLTPTPGIVGSSWPPQGKCCCPHEPWRECRQVRPVHRGCARIRKRYSGCRVLQTVKTKQLHAPKNMAGAEFSCRCLMPRLARSSLKTRSIYSRSEPLRGCRRAQKPGHGIPLLPGLGAGSCERSQGARLAALRTAHRCVGAIHALACARDRAWP